MAFFGQDQFVAAGAAMLDAGGVRCLLITSKGSVYTKTIYQTVQVEVGEFGTQFVNKHSFTFTCAQPNGGDKPLIGDKVRMLPSNEEFEFDDVTFDNGVLITLLGESLGS